ncbi:MAG: hypothetical protein NWE98_09845 [Candidatus Bathyarchaeota archaeon]|nr:hypothetical protein [Candidatus Bathyarchaeota archaeon]
MIRTAANRKNLSIVLTAILITAVTVPSVFTSGMIRSELTINTYAIKNLAPHPSSLPTNVAANGNTENPNETIKYDPATESLIEAPSPTGTSTPQSATYNPLMQNFYGMFLSGKDSHDATATQLDFSGFKSVPLDTPKFMTYTYGGYPVEQSSLTQFFFSFPNFTNQGQLAGSDAVTFEMYPIKKMDFDAIFLTPNFGALGFDEMAIFAASDTMTYKGTEFGIRMDLKNSFIYGYIQEPEGSVGEVNFQMQKLILNDGLMHHYTLITMGHYVLFLIDGIGYGRLSYPSGTGYSNLNYSVCLVVHRFSDDWDSSSDNMIVDNFVLNQH